MAQFINRLFQVPNKIISGKSFFRTITATKHLCDNYEGDGKTTVTILNRQYRHLIMINSISNHGFRLNNDIFVLGPVAVFPRTVLQWNVSDTESLTPESLSLFALLEPKIDIFILGTGDKRILPRREVLEFFRGKKITMEILPTESACSTFNFLNVEGRCVAAGFIPPSEVQIHEEEMRILESGNPGEGGYLI